MEPLDAEVCSAIREVVAEHGESEKVAERLLHWLAQISKGEMDLSRRADTEEYFDLLSTHLRQPQVEQ
jgi:hypothetical protein